MTQETTTVLPRCEDGWFLHFLKELPIPVWILLFTSMFLASSILWQLDYIPRLIDGLIGALLLSMKTPSRLQNTNIQTDNVKAENIEAASTQTGDIIASPDTISGGKVPND